MRIFTSTWKGENANYSDMWSDWPGKHRWLGRQKERGKIGQTKNNTKMNHVRRPEGCRTDLSHSGKEGQRQSELKVVGLTSGTAARTARERGNWRLSSWPQAQRQGQPKTEGTEGCWADLGQIDKESPRQMELKAVRLTSGTAARRAQDIGNWRLPGWPGAQRQGEPKTEGTDGCRAYLGHSGKESQRHRELTAAGLTSGTAARRAKYIGNWRLPGWPGAQRQEEPKTEGTDGCWADLVHKMMEIVLPTNLGCSPVNPYRCYLHTGNHLLYLHISNKHTPNCI